MGVPPWSWGWGVCPGALACRGSGRSPPPRHLAEGGSSKTERRGSGQGPGPGEWGLRIHFHFSLSRPGAASGKSQREYRGSSGPRAQACCDGPLISEPEPPQLWSPQLPLSSLPPQHTLHPLLLIRVPTALPWNAASPARGRLSASLSFLGAF